MLVDDCHTNVSIVDKYDLTPLHWAARQGHLDVARMLVVDGHANVDIADKDGHTPLYWAAGGGHLDMARMLVDDGHANVNIVASFSRTPLHIATQYGKSDVARFLLDKGAKPDKGDFVNVTPIDFAARPRDRNGNMVAPDVALLCRMICESGALIVLATKVVFGRFAREDLLEDRLKRLAEGVAADDTMTKRHCPDA